MTFTIVTLEARREHLVDQTAQLLLDGLRDRTDSWPDLAAARAEVLDSLAPGRISRIMLEPAGGSRGTAP